MSNVIDIKSKLAGMNALCTANPYLKMNVGGGIPGHDKRKIKEIVARESAIIGDLNPQFLSFFELDCEFPQDGKLEV